MLSCQYLVSTMRMKFGVNGSLEASSFVIYMPASEKLKFMAAGFKGQSLATPHLPSALGLPKDKGILVILISSRLTKIRSNLRVINKKLMTQKVHIA